MARIVKTTSLYTLIVKPDQSFELKVDGESVRNGTLLEDFTPSVNPDEEIDDPNDTKPEEWVDEARIADPEATSLRTGVRMSPPPFPTRRLRSPRTGTTRRMVTGSRPPFPTPSATRPLAAASGSLL
jgi:hypothetical protein